MKDKELSFIERMKLRATSQKSYGGKSTETDAGTAESSCINCGAGRAKQDGLTHCAYCGHAFIKTTLSDGSYIKMSDNSKT